jgi:hypothetical protein
MKKTPIAIVIFVTILIFAGADYAINIPKQKTSVITAPGVNDEHPNLIQLLLEKHPLPLNYKITKRYRSTQIFEKIDLSRVEDLRVYRNRLEAENDISPLIIYEIQGPSGQGGLTYLNVKLAFKNQMDATEQFNEDNQFGHSSFYFNDLNNQSTSFLLVQINDHLFGFEFNKKEAKNFEIIKNMIETLKTI